MPKIFEQEILDGLEDALKASASISYASVANSCVKPKDATGVKFYKSVASIEDADLYYTQSILVTSSWNKNDDIFDKLEVWNAKNTPEDKPTNLEHDESVIVGHITSNWPITEEGELISEDINPEMLPDKYHILTGSVIYKGFSNEDLRERSSKLISEIDNGTKYVSMECFFKGFDYGLINKTTGEYTVLSRNEATAYLTKFLRAYGGIGEHDNYKVGRVLRNITFSGKGFVDRPANEDSIIFTKNIFPEKNDDFSLSGVSISQSNNKSETITMSSEKKVVETVVANEAVVDTATVSTVETTLKSQITELTQSNEQLKTEVAEAARKSEEQIKAIKEEAAQNIVSVQEELKKIQSEIEAANEVIAAYKAKEMEMVKKDKKMKRQAALVDQGIDLDVATSTVDKFESLDDETFDAMTSLFAGKMPPWLENIDKKKKDSKTEDSKDAKKKASEENSSVEALETAEVEASVNLAVGEESTEESAEVETTRAALNEFVCSRLGKKHK
jgi:hypothetical protein